MRRAAGIICVLSVLAGSAALAGPAVDHSDWDKLLKTYVDANGLVDYKTWKEKDVKALDAYLEKLAAVKDEEKLPREERLALWINAYNAITIRATLDLYPIDSIKDKFWKTAKWTIAGKEKLSLDHIEHEILRKMNPKEPRIHFAIVCASKGCPYLRPGAFTADKLDAQLEEQVKKCFADPKKLSINAKKKTVSAIKLFDWFKEDFGASEPQRLTWIAKHVDNAADKAVCLDKDASLEFLDWDWSLNEKK